MKSVDSRLAVEDANTRFYDAFRSGNIKVKAQKAPHNMPPMCSLSEYIIQIPGMGPNKGAELHVDVVCLCRRWRKCGGKGITYPSFTQARSVQRGERR